MAKGELSAMVCILFCVSLFVLGLAVPTVYFGFEDENSTCQRGEHGGLNLSDWVKGVGLSAVILVFVQLSCVALAGVTNGVTLFVAMIYAGFDLVLWIIWWIWGTVILATNENNSCVADGKGMAIVAIINLLVC